MDRFEELLAGYLEGALSADETAELAAAVERDPDRRRRFLELTGMDGLLRARLGRPGDEEDLLRRISVCLVGREQEERTAERVIERIESVRPVTPRRLRAVRLRRQAPPGSPALFWGIAAAAAVIFLGALAATFGAKKNPSPVAPVARPASVEEPEAPPPAPPPPPPPAPKPAPPPPSPPVEAPAPALKPDPSPPEPAPRPAEAAPKPPPRPTVTVVARLERLDGAAHLLADGTPRPAQAGQEIAAGQGLETGDGTAVVRFADGTRLEVRPESRVRELSESAVGGKNLALERGSLAADVPRQPLPMTVTTPLAVVRVLGTRFTVAADPASTRLDVSEGRVEMARREDGATVVVPADHYAVAARGTPLEARPALAVVSFTLMNADTDRPLPEFDPLKDGAVIVLSKLPTRNLNIRANTVPATVGCVQFGLDGDANFNTEREGPYALQTGSKDDFSAWTPAVGPHTLTATPWSGPPAPGKRGGTGAAGRPLTIRFTVK